MKYAVLFSLLLSAVFGFAQRTVVPPVRKPIPVAFPNGGTPFPTTVINTGQVFRDVQILVSSGRNTNPGSEEQQRTRVMEPAAMSTRALTNGVIKNQIIMHVVHFSGALMSDVQSGNADKWSSKAHIPDAQSDFLQPGVYSINNIANSTGITLDGIAVPPNTRLIIYGGANKSVVLDVTGPAIVNNIIRNVPQYNEANTKTYIPDLQSIYPQNVRSWSPTDMHKWAISSIEIQDLGSNTPAPIVADEQTIETKISEHTVHFSGALMSDEFKEKTTSKIYQEDAYSNFLKPGNYSDLSSSLPNAIEYSFDGIAIPPKTRLIVYSDKNFDGAVLLDITGPAIINNAKWASYTDYQTLTAKNYSTELQEMFPQTVRREGSEKMQNWHGSLVIQVIPE